jgi:hypothetical protein
MHVSVLLILVLASSRQLCLASSLLRPSCDLYDHALPSAISSSQYGSFPGHLVPCVRISLVHLSALHSATASWSSFSCFPASWSSYLSPLSSLYAVQHEICYSSMPGATIGKFLIDARYYRALAPGPALPRRASLPAPNPGNRPLQRRSSGSLSSSLPLTFDRRSRTPPRPPHRPAFLRSSFRAPFFLRLHGMLDDFLSMSAATYFLTTILFTTLSTVQPY